MKFYKSIHRLEDKPLDMPEVCIIGHSNSGKSSLLNALAGAQVARVSQSPGKTSALNFFKEKDFYWVDTPGYGYARVSWSERARWKKMMEEYLVASEQLRGVILMLDSARKWTEQEEELLSWLREYGLEVVVILSKADKLNQSQKFQKKQDFEKHSSASKMFWISVKKEQTIKGLVDYIYKNWVKTAF